MFQPFIFRGFLLVQLPGRFFGDSKQAWTDNFVLGASVGGIGFVGYAAMLNLQGRLVGFWGVTSCIFCHLLEPTWHSLAKPLWLVVEPTHLKNMLVKLGSFPQIFGIKIKNPWNQHPAQKKKNFHLLFKYQWDKNRKYLICHHPALLITGSLTSPSVIRQLW